MSDNDRILLNNLLLQRAEEIGSAASEEEFFEIFSAEQILKNDDLTYDEIEDGIVDAGNDGGIDSIFCFVNDELVNEDTDFSAYRRGCIVRIVVIQSKIGKGFSESAVNSLYVSTKYLFDLSRSLEELSSMYNSKLIERITVIRRAIRELNAKFPAYWFEFYYVCKGGEPNGIVAERARAIGLLTEQYFSQSRFKFEFVGARELRDLASRAPVTSLSVALAENPISTGKGGFVCLLALSSYFQFIADREGILRRHLFEWNVRDYQGSTPVNEGIQASLESSSSGDDFWWLNNGITILASAASLSGKELTIENPQIVNGLQTSMEIYRYLKSHPDEKDTRAVLVRVIVPENEASRDRIIKATNSQTIIPIASLRATDQLQRDIEAYFGSNHYHYDRRKNFHKNQGASKDKVITIPYLAQAVMAIVLQKPDDSRARPSSLLKSDEDYRRVFNSSFPIETFLKCVLIMRRVEQFFRTNRPTLTSNDRNNEKYHVAMVASAMVTGVRKPNASDIATSSISDFSDSLLDTATSTIEADMASFGTQRALSNDQVAKSPEFVKSLASSLSERLPAFTS